jgi:hypothetical protein
MARTNYLWHTSPSAVLCELSEPTEKKALAHRNGRFRRAGGGPIAHATRMLLAKRTNVQRIATANSEALSHGVRIPMKSPGRSEMMAPVDSDMMSPRA